MTTTVAAGPSLTLVQDARTRAAGGSRLPVGELMRSWRERRGFSQLGLASVAEISVRHLSFLETGRSRPSREMIARLSEHLELAPREQNELLLAAGFAPAFTALSLHAEEMELVRAELRGIVAANEPFPAHVVDRAWNVVESNAGFGIFAHEADPALLTAPVNALRLAMHPDGMQPRIRNFAEWSRALLLRLARRVALTGDPGLAGLYDELSGYVPRAAMGREDAAGLMVPLRIEHGGRELALFCTIATFGMPLDVTVSELAIETFLPADPETAGILRRLG